MDATRAGGDTRSGTASGPPRGHRSSRRGSADGGRWRRARWAESLDHVSGLCQTDGGIVRPRAFAAFRLIMNSNVVGLMTGRSAGFAPLRMRSTYAALWRGTSFPSLKDSKPPAFTKSGVVGDGRELVLGRKVRDLWEIARDPLARPPPGGPRRARCSRPRRPWRSRRGPGFEPLNLDAEHAGRITHGRKCASGGLEDGDPHGAGDGALEVLQPLQVEVVGVANPVRFPPGRA